jgi:hypothetical protein
MKYVLRWLCSLPAIPWLWHGVVVTAWTHDYSEKAALQTLAGVVWLIAVEWVWCRAFAKEIS